MKKTVRTATLFVSIAATFIMGFVAYLEKDIPDDFYIGEQQELQIHQHRQVTVTSARQEADQPVEADFSTVETVELKLLGVIPVKTAQLHQTTECYLAPGGTPFGLKMLTAGVVVVGLSPIETEQGTVCPAQSAGLRKGDIILSVDGQTISSFDELSQSVRETEGESVDFCLIREGEQVTLSVIPVKCQSDGDYKCGIWVRDSSAGIGTVTFYNPLTGDFGGLGHAVCDVDTGEPLPLSSGEVVPVTILDVVKGTAGTPGELKGTFLSRSAVGTLQINNETGIYGQLKHPPTKNEPIPVGFKQDVTIGKARIYTTISGTSPQSYEVEIEKIHLNDHSPTKNMVVRITDPALLAETGGIVQGMSGSPIIQDGKLIGAVTHVFVNDPTRGYGIFIENMLEAAG